MHLFAKLQYISSNLIFLETLGLGHISNSYITERTSMYEQ